MLKVLIVDDEINICKLITRLIDWEGLGLEYCGYANSALQALAIVDEKNPDIVITDIKMTGMDGLTLIKKIKEKYEDIKCIIISGYRFFDYAYSAIKYGATDFLLKPINQSELNDVLQNLVDKINENNSVHNDIQNDTNSRDFIRKQFLLNIIRHDYVKNISLREINSTFFYHLTEDVKLIGIVQIDRGTSKLEFQSIVISKLLSLFHESFSEVCFDFEIIEYNTQLIFLLNYNDKKQDVINKAFERYLKLSTRILKPYGVIKITIGKGCLIYDVVDLYRSYYVAQRAVLSRLMLGVNQVIEGEEIYTTFPKQWPPDISTEKAELRNNAALLSREAMLDTVEKTIAKVRSYFNAQPWAVCKWYKEFWNTFTMIMSEVHNELDRALLKSNFFSHADICSSESELKKMLFLHMEKIIENCKNAYDDMHIKTIQIVNSYIIDHYTSKLDLETISKQVCLSPAYLGILYKKETGINISDYIANTRIEKSKKFLEDGRYNISEVALMVGYKDSRYFSNLFKQTVGVKPSEYKKIIKFGKLKGRANE